MTLNRWFCASFYSKTCHQLKGTNFRTKKILLCEHSAKSWNPAKAETRHNLLWFLVADKFLQREGILWKPDAQGNYLETEASKQNVKKIHPLSSVLLSEGVLGCTRTPSEGSRITILKPSLEMNQLIFWRWRARRSRLTQGSTQSWTWRRTQRTRSKKSGDHSHQNLTALGGEWLMCWEMSDWCVCKRHCNCFIFAWHLWRVSLLGFYLSPTAGWGDLREENLVINLLRLYEY